MPGLHLKFHHFLFLALICAGLMLIIHLRRLWISRSAIVVPLNTRRVDGDRKGGAKRKVLTPNDMMILGTSEKMIRAGSIIPAANLLEQSGLFREAITALEEAKFIDEAAAILLRMQKPERAAILFSRHEKWGPAARCFVQSGATEKAAQCFERDKQYLQAAKIYYGTGQFGNAAKCFEFEKNYESAANCWFKINEHPRALNNLLKMAQNAAALSKFQPSEAMMDFLFAAMKNGMLDGPIIATLAKSPKIVPWTFLLLVDAQFDAAAKLLKLASPDVVTAMLREVKIQNPEAKPLAAFFGKIGEHNKSGILFEQLGMFSEAESAFSAAGDKGRADYCRTRAGKNGVRSPSSVPQEGLANASEQVSDARAENKKSFMIHSGDTINTVIKGVPTKDASAASVSLPDSSALIHHALSPQEISKFKNSSLLIGAKDHDLEQFLSIFKVQKFDPRQGFDSGTEGQLLACLLEGEITSASGIPAVAGWLHPEQGLSGRGTTSWTVISRSKVLTVDRGFLDKFFDGNSIFTRQVYTNLTRLMLRQSA